MFVGELDKVHDWTQHTLIIPAVSVGNVGQLSVDLLISTLSPRLVGYLHTDSVLPVVGNDPFGHKDTSTFCQLTVALQVYESEQHKLIIVQQRAPCVKGKVQKFSDELIAWIQSCQFSRVVLLTSMFADERRDAQLSGCQTRFLATESAKADLSVQLESKQNRQLETRPPVDMHGSSNSDELFIPGGGIAKSFYLKCATANVKAIVLLVFCAEGDNVSDAVLLSSYANAWFQWLPSRSNVDEYVSWKPPTSWKLQFGSNFDRSIF